MRFGFAPRTSPDTIQSSTLASGTYPMEIILVAVESSRFATPYSGTAIRMMLAADALCPSKRREGEASDRHWITKSGALSKSALPYES